MSISFHTVMINFILILFTLINELNILFIITNKYSKQVTLIDEKDTFIIAQ